VHEILTQRGFSSSFIKEPVPPNSLRIGFTATYASGEIQIDQNELADAAWFTKEPTNDSTKA
jgi:NADH pyrophosphatase NudC (nudix superfamily)